MKLIVGLGNPGEKYESTWHNVGFLSVDELQANGFSAWRNSGKHKLLAAEGNINGEKVILVKPQTFMNNSGEAVQAIANFYKISTEDIYVIHDELDLPLGKIKISEDSSAGGHNGIKSLIAHLNTQQFIRLRIGIKTQDPLLMPANKYVLKKIGLIDKMTVRKVIKNSVVPAIRLLFEKGLDEAKNEFN